MSRADVDVIKLQAIKQALQEFNESMQNSAGDIEQYLREKEEQIRINFNRKINEFEEREAARRAEIANADEKRVAAIRERHRRQREADIEELNQLKKSIIRFSTSSDELKSKLHQLSGVGSERIAQSTSTIGKCITILEEYLAINTGVSGTSVGSALFSESSNNSANNIESFDDYSSMWLASLSDNERNAIIDYTKEVPPYYKNINAVLRGESSNYDCGNEERSGFIHSALSKASTPEDMMLFRGCGSDALGDAATCSDDELCGLIIFDQGFTSTSTSPDIADIFADDVILAIHLPAGSHAAGINQISAVGSYEQEVLLDRGTMFAITSVTRDNRGRRTLNVEAFTSHE